MSLLLDALKKAAEQKAAKNKSEAPGAGPSDETQLDDGAEDITELMKGADDGLKQSNSCRTNPRRAAGSYRYPAGNLRYH
jgi:hypothetical protein